jgi:hypothetical protein
MVLATLVLMKPKLHVYKATMVHARLPWVAHHIPESKLERLTAEMALEFVLFRPTEKLQLGEHKNR